MTSNIIDIIHTEIKVNKGEEIYTENYMTLLDNMIISIKGYLKDHGNTKTFRITTIIEE